MLDRAFRLSSNWTYFSEECDRLKLLFSHLEYPDDLINSTITRSIAIKASDQPVPSPTDNNSPEPVRIVLPFKDQASADFLHTQLKDLSMKTNTTIQPVFISHKIERDLKSREVKPPVINQQSLVYHFKCDLCDAGYVGFTRRHLHQRVDSTKIHRQHFREEHSLTPKDLANNFSIFVVDFRRPRASPYSSSILQYLKVLHLRVRVCFVASCSSFPIFLVLAASCSI